MKHSRRVVTAFMLSRLISFLLIAILLISGSPLAYANLPADKEYKFYYYLHDNLGGIQSVLDDKGNVVCTNDYLPYGEERNGDCMNKDEEDYGFTGKEKDEETGLMYYGARYYDPVIGRFTAQDPLVSDPTLKGEALQKLLTDPQALNPYTYARNNPVKYVDPTGETFTEAAVWYMGSVLYLNAKGYDIAAAFLRHSIRSNPFSSAAGRAQSLYFNTAGSNKMSRKIGEKIRNTDAYKNVLSNVKDILQSGKLNADDQTLSDNFSKSDNPDLFYAMNKFNYAFNATETENGNYNVNIRITDTYDFKKENDGGFASTMNNMAVFSQKTNTILNYDITIDLKEIVQIEKEKEKEGEKGKKGSGK